MENQKRNNKEIKKHKNVCLSRFISGLLFLILIVGCTSSPSQTPQTSVQTPAAPEVASCTTKECFISSANECNDMTLTLTEDAGVFKYVSSKDCIFTKTLVSLDTSETQEMKNLMQGKSLTCKYEKGKFDQRWVTSLIFGTEYCEGELKDILVKLIVFA